MMYVGYLRFNSPFILANILEEKDPYIIWKKQIGHYISDIRSGNY